jgi:hypothetical protein
MPVMTRAAKFFVRNRFFLGAEFFNHAALQEMLFHQEGDVICAQVGVVDVFGVNQHVRTQPVWVADARGLKHLHFIKQALGDQLVIEGIDDFMRAFCQALRVNGNKNM